MSADKKIAAKPSKKSKRCVILTLIAFFIALVLLLVLLIPAFVSSQKGQKTILAKLNDSISGRVNFTDLSMGWLKGIKITDFSFKDEAGKTSLQIKNLTTKPHYSSLVFGNLSFGKTTLEEPKMSVNLQKQKVNAKKISTPSSHKTTETSGPLLPVSQIDLTINNGNLKVTKGEKTSVAISKFNSDVQLRPPGKTSLFNIDMILAANDKHSSLTASGLLAPDRKKGWNWQGTTGQLTIDINDLDLESLQPLFEMAGIQIEAKGRLSTKLHGKIKNGQFKQLKGTAKAENLKLTAEPLKGDKIKTDNLDLTVDLEQKQDFIDIANLDIHADWFDATAKGQLPTTFNSLTEFVKAESQQKLTANLMCNVAELASQLPQTLGIKKGLNISAGTLRADVEKITEQQKAKIIAAASLADLQGIIDNKTLELSAPIKAQAQISADAEKIKYEQVTIDAPFAQLDCSGTNRLLNFKANINLALLQSELGQFLDIGPYQMTGLLFSEGQIQPDGDKIEAGGTAELQGFKLTSATGETADEPAANIRFDIAIVPGRQISLAQPAEINANLGNFTCKDLHIGLAESDQQPPGSNPPWRINLTAKDLDLKRAGAFAVVTGAMPPEIQLAGQAHGDIDVEKTVKSFKISAEPLEINNFLLGKTGQKPFTRENVRIILDVELDPAARTRTVNKLQLQTEQINIDFTGTEKNHNGTTELHGTAEYDFDWSAVSDIAAPFMPHGLRLKGQTTDTIKFNSQYPADRTDKTLQNLTTAGSLQFENADYLGLNLGPTEINLKIQNGLLEILPFATTVNKGTLSFAAKADFNSEKTLLKTTSPLHIAKDINITKETCRQLLMYLNPVFANVIDISGVANLRCDKLEIPLRHAQATDAKVVGTIWVDNLRLDASQLLGKILSVAGENAGGQIITIHPTNFVVSNGIVRYPDMQMDVGNNPVNFAGTIGLDKSLDMKVTLPYTTAGRTARTDRNVPGKRIVVPLTGSIDNPVLDLSRLLEGQVKEQLENLLREKIGEELEELFK